MKNKELKNKEYSLLQLFSTSIQKIIIPDFQRDYCWGDKTHGEKNNTDIISGFLDTLIEEFTNNQNSNVLLGKIDVYEHPADYIYLTDGQQRLTSLYLLLGMLYRNEKEPILKEQMKGCLVNNQYNNEPYLQYAVRESTVFFLNDLVHYFFLKNKELKVSDIAKQPWYFSDYNLDPSVISMISALDIIESKQKEMDVEGFSAFLINKVKIQYYEVQDKKQGEERFVIINTTGKSLTVSENIKPILLANTQNIDFFKQWEERENFFWHNRDRDPKEVIADDGVNDFLTWCFQIIDQQHDINLIKQAKLRLKENKNETYLIEIHHLFHALNQLIEYLAEDKFQTQFKFINDTIEVKNIRNLRNLTKEKQHNILLPLLSFISKFQGEKENAYRFLRRLRKNYYDLQWSDRNNNYVDWRYILQMIQTSDSIAQLLQFDTTITPLSLIQNVKLNNWFNEEEKIKLELKQYQDQIEQWEDHEDFLGDLSFLLKSSLAKPDDIEVPSLSEHSTFSISDLTIVYQNYIETVDELKKLKKDHELKERYNNKLINLFRLYRVLTNCNEIGHISQTSGEFHGVLFSTMNRKHLNKIEFIKLFKQNDVTSSLKSYIKKLIISENIFDVNESNYSVKKFIKSWLSLKTFKANKEDKLLFAHDGNDTGVAAYLNYEDNKLLDSLPFTLGNSICGFGVKSGGGGGNYVSTTTNEDLWCNSSTIDTPFFNIAYQKDKRTEEQINNNQETIDSIINEIVSS